MFKGLHSIRELMTEQPKHTTHGTASLHKNNSDISGNSIEIIATTRTTDSLMIAVFV